MTRRAYSDDEIRAALEASHGNIAATARALGANERSLRRRIKAMRGAQEAPDGFKVTGKSTLIDRRTGETVLEWVKISRDAERQRELMEAAIAALASEIPRAEPVQAPEWTNAALIGRIPVDSIYSPVLQVSYKVEATRVEQRTDFDKLIIDVETKHSMIPRDAFASAGKTLVELFGLAADLNLEAEGIELGEPPVEETQSSDLQRPITILNLPARSQNCLQREGIETIGQLILRSEADLLDIRNFGAKSIEDVKDELAKLELSLKDSPGSFMGGYDDSYGSSMFSDDVH